MPNDRTQSPSLQDQQRWKRELEVSQLLSQQRSPGFFPGPGAADGGSGGGGGSKAVGGGAEAQMASAGKDILSGEMSASDAATQLAATALKQALEKYVWPIVPDVVDGSGFVALTTLQIYWVASWFKVRGTQPMKMWEHLVLGLCTMFELFILVAVLTLLSLQICMITPSCIADMSSQFSFGDLFSSLNLF